MIMTTCLEAIGFVEEECSIPGEALVEAKEAESPGLEG